MADEPDRSGKPYRGRTRAEHEALLVGKLTPRALRFALAFAGLFQLTHELLKSAILENVHQYYWRGFDASGDLYDDASYRRDVLDPSRSGGKTSAFRPDLHTSGQLCGFAGSSRLIKAIWPPTSGH